MNDKLFFVVNPYAGNGKAKTLWPKVMDTLHQKNIAFDYQETQSKSDGIRIAREAASKNYKCYISVGGDGTFHEMINGLLLANLAQTPTAFLLPIGTGNDFVRTHRIPKWGDRWLQILQNFQTKRHNAGKLSYFDGKQSSSRYFVNVAGFFYDGYIVRATTLRKKAISSSFQYLAIILMHLFRYRPQKGMIKWAGGEASGAFYTANVGISRYSGGGMQFVPHADPFGNEFAVSIAKSMHPIRVLFSTHYFYNGKVAKHRKLTCFHTDSLHISPLGGDEVLVEADGEFLGTSPTQVTLISDAFRLVVGG